MNSFFFVTYEHKYNQNRIENFFYEFRIHGLRTKGGKICLRFNKFSIVISKCYIGRKFG